MNIANDSCIFCAWKIVKGILKASEHVDDVIRITLFKEFFLRPEHTFLLNFHECVTAEINSFLLQSNHQFCNW